MDANSTIKNTHKCTYNDSDGDKDKFNELFLEDNYCLDYGNFSLKGSFSEPEVSFLEVGVKMCLNLLRTISLVKAMRKFKKN